MQLLYLHHQQYQHQQLKLVQKVNHKINLIFATNDNKLYTATSKILITRSTSSKGKSVITNMLHHTEYSHALFHSCDCHYSYIVYIILHDSKT